MVQNRALAEGYTEFVATNEKKLRGALMACLGADIGREAAAEALAYGWENWDRVEQMENPLGYLFVVGRSRGRRLAKGMHAVFPVPSQDSDLPWIEPGLPAALAALPERQRTAVLLVHGYGMSLSEVAHILGISRNTVHGHTGRALRKLRRKLGVAS